MRRRMRTSVGLAVVVVACMVVMVRSGRGAVPRPSPALSGNRAPFDLVFSPDGRRAYVTEWAEGSVAVVETASGRISARLPSGGRRPTALALTPDGRTLVVTNSESGSVAFLDVSQLPLTAAHSLGETAKRRTAVALSPALARSPPRPVAPSPAPRLAPLPGMPFDVVLARGGEVAFVALSQLDQVAVVDVRTGRVIDRIPVGARPRALARTPDGSLVLCANMRGSVSVIDTATRRETGRVRIPAVNVRGIAVSPDGRSAYVTAQRAQNERPTETAVGIWSNQMFGLSIDGTRVRLRDDLWLDVLAEGVADPEGIVLAADGRAYVSFAGSHAVAALQVRGDFKLDAHRFPGCGPRGLALTPDGRQLWVANHLGNSIAVLEAETLNPVRTVNLGSPSRSDPNLYGRYLFESAFLARGGQFSCNSCHPDGHTDGISWKFVHVTDGVEDRNVRSLLGRLSATAPFRWSGQDADLTTFVQSEITGLLQHPRLGDADVKALVHYLSDLPLPPNPHRGPGGGFTPAALRGRVVFGGKAGCADCHSGPSFGGTGRRAWVGTTRPDLPLDVPHLTGVHDTGPFLHDGRAATLDEVFTRYNPGADHGKANLLSTEELSDLIAFVREL